MAHLYNAAWVFAHDDYLRWNAFAIKVASTLHLLAANNVRVASVSVPRWVFEHQFRYLCRYPLDEETPVPTLDTWNWGVYGSLPIVLDASLANDAYRIEFSAVQKEEPNGNPC